MSQTKRKRGRPKKDPAGEKKAGTKTLHIRERVQFAIEFWAGWEDKTDTAFIEQSVEHNADALSRKNDVDWRACFHPHKGVRWLRMYLLKDYPFTDDHEARRNFVMQHRQFFYVVADDDVIANVANIEALCGPMDGEPSTHWAQLDAFRKPTNNVFDSGRALASALRARGIEPPTWPPEGSTL